MKKAVMVIAQDNFRDEELFEPKQILEENNIKVKIASTSLNTAKGMLGATAKPDILLADINLDDFDAIIFVGGSGAAVYWDDTYTHQLARDAVAKGKVVAAICIAPVTLAKAGILKGKQATVWPSEAGELKEAGVNYTGKPVEKDGNIITAAGPHAASEFGKELVKVIGK